MNQDERLARKRFLAISLIRLSGAVFLTLGLFTVGGKVDMPPIAGWLFVAIGLFDFLILPRLLARRWKSPQP